MSLVHDRVGSRVTRWPTIHDSAQRTALREASLAFVSRILTEAGSGGYGEVDRHPR